MLKLLENIFASCYFENPCNGKYAWIGADKADVMVLGDFKYTKDVIAWRDLLLLLVGETVKLPTPNNLYSTDVEIRETQQSLQRANALSIILAHITQPMKERTR